MSRRYQRGRSVDASEVLFTRLDSLEALTEDVATYYSDEINAYYKISLPSDLSTPFKEIYF
jgi:hypothetical protein